MIATKESTVHDAVIILLRRAGYSPIQAEARWDSTYSKQYESARPGTHKFIIGKYEFEYTKQPVDIFQAIAQEHVEAVKQESASRTRSWVATIAVIVIVIAICIVIF